MSNTKGGYSLSFLNAPRPTKNSTTVESWDEAKDELCPVTVKVGDVVGFKADVEQYGKITKITSGSYGADMLTLKAEGVFFEGGYIGGQTTTEVASDRCWI